MGTYIKAGSPQEWVRPGGWVSIPSITSADTKFYGVYAVYENRKNNVYIVFQNGVYNITVDWGDGSANTTVTTNITVSKTYQYSALTTPILVDDYGENYKTVLVTATQNSGSLGLLGLGSSTGIGNNNWLDVVLSWSSARVNLVKTFPLLQRFIQYTGSWQGINANSYMIGLTACRVFQLPTNLGSPTQAVSVLVGLGDCEVNDITVGGVISVNTFFSPSRIRKVGNINFSAATTTNQIFASCHNLREVGDVNLSSATTISSMFLNCFNLFKIGTITSTSLNNMNSIFNSCYSLREVKFTNLTNVTVVTSPFASCFALESVRVPNLKVSISFIDCSMERDALVQVFTDLGTPASTQTITVTRNPGSADLTAADLLIATSKNWIVTL